MFERIAYHSACRSMSVSFRHLVVEPPAALSFVTEYRAVQIIHVKHGWNDDRSITG